MGKQLIAKNPQVTVVYRFINKLIYLKCNTLEYGQQLIAQLRAKGLSIKVTGDWAQIDLFGERTFVKLGQVEIDLSIVTDREVEDLLCDFYRTTLEAQNFTCEVKDL